VNVGWDQAAARKIRTRRKQITKMTLEAQRLEHLQVVQRPAVWAGQSEEVCLSYDHLLVRLLLTGNDRCLHSGR
jgi:hypothetical protein